MGILFRSSRLTIFIGWYDAFRGRQEAPQDGPALWEGNTPTKRAFLRHSFLRAAGKGKARVRHNVNLHSGASNSLTNWKSSNKYFLPAFENVSVLSCEEQTRQGTHVISSVIVATVMKT